MTPRTKQPTDKLPRVCRGGAWDGSSATDVRAAYRDDVAPMYRFYDVGFRTAQTGCRQPVLKGLTPP